MLYNTDFYSKYLQITEKAVPLQCVFHSIRFKVNKGWSKALLLFLYLYVSLTFRNQLFHPHFVDIPTDWEVHSGNILYHKI